MQLVRRFWAPAIILLMVAIHAAVIGYVRSRVARLSNMESAAIEIGHLRFQNPSVADCTYQFQLHAIVDPSRRFRGEELLRQHQLPITEAAEQMLRQVDPSWLNDPSQKEIRERLMDVVLQHLEEPLVQRVVITDWLCLPSGSVSMTPMTASL